MTIPHGLGKRGAAVPWLNWIEQPPPKGQVTGSNPVGITTFRTKTVASHADATVLTPGRSLSRAGSLARPDTMRARRTPGGPLIGPCLGGVRSGSASPLSVIVTLRLGWIRSSGRSG